MTARKPSNVESAADDADTTGDVPQKLTVDIEVLLKMSEDAVWMLQKKLLRQYFLALQSHFRSIGRTIQSGTDTVAGLNVPSVPSVPSPPPQQPVNTSPFLSLPAEIRRLILLHLLSRPSSSPARGPHPRSLQTSLSLTRTMDPSILRVNRQLYAEGCALLYGTQEIHAHVNFDVWAHRRDRSTLTLSSVVRSFVRHLHVHIFLGNEKKRAKPGRKESQARLEVVKKGVRKLAKWLVGPLDISAGTGDKEWRLQMLRISWQEPPQTYTWEQKKTVLDEFRAMRPLQVQAGEINWGLKYPGKKFRFVEEYLVEIGQVRESQEEEGGPASAGEGASYDVMDTAT